VCTRRALHAVGKCGERWRSGREAVEAWRLQRSTSLSHTESDSSSYGARFLLSPRILPATTRFYRSRFYQLGQSVLLARVPPPLFSGNHGRDHDAHLHDHREYDEISKSTRDLGGKNGGLVNCDTQFQPRPEFLFSIKANLDRSDTLHRCLCHLQSSFFSCLLCSGSGFVCTTFDIRMMRTLKRSREYILKEEKDNSAQEPSRNDASAIRSHTCMHMSII